MNRAYQVVGYDITVVAGIPTRTNYHIILDDEPAPAPAGDSFPPMRFLEDDYPFGPLLYPYRPELFEGRR